MADKITFLASFPAIQSAIKIDGSGGMRIALDIPESEMAEAIKLTLFRQVVIRVTVEPNEQAQEPDDQTRESGSAGNGRRTLKRSTAKKRD